MSGVELLKIVNNKGVSGLKRRSLGIILVLLVGFVFLLPAAASAGTIGFVDFEFLFYAHPEYEVKNQHLQDMAEELYQKARDEAEKLETEEEINELGAYYEYQFEQIEQGVRVELVSFILEVIEEVASKQGIDVVLPETSIIYGGINLTSQIVEAMYERYGISVPTAIKEAM